MKSKSALCIIPAGPVFNIDEITLFESFDREHSTLLLSSLYLNAAEVINSFQGSEVILVLDNRDNGFIPGVLNEHKNKIYFADCSERGLLLKNLNEKLFRNNDMNIVFNSNSIGYSHQDILKIFNLLNTMDDSIVLGRSASGKVCFSGFNIYTDFLDSTNQEYDTVLSNVCKTNSFIYTLDNFMYINDKADFRNLYTELSKKESLAYCSHSMHENFTHLFIEYKDLLK